MPALGHNACVGRPAGVLLALMGGLGLASPALATDHAITASDVQATASEPLVARIEVEKLVVEDEADGTSDRRFVDARQVEAGEEIFYTIRVTNPGRAPAENVVVTKPLPYGVEYVTGSAVGPGCEVLLSADGGVTFARSGLKAPYTHVRWVFDLPLAPGATALLRFRAVFR